MMMRRLHKHGSICHRLSNFWFNWRVLKQSFFTAWRLNGTAPKFNNNGNFTYLIIKDGQLKLDIKER